MTEEVPPGEESDIRRRAAWLLGMLVLVAALFVTLMVTLLGSSGGSHDSADVTDPIVTSTPTHASSTPAAGRSSTPAGRSSRSGGGSSAPSSGSSGSSGSGSQSPSTSAPTEPASCPTKAVCALPDDIGNAVGAINAYREKHGQKAVPGSVTKAAQACALSNGSHCSGGWAESQVPAATGDAVISKIASLGKLTDPMTSLEVGWAYNPTGKQFFFALIRDS